MTKNVVACVSFGFAEADLHICVGCFGGGCDRARLVRPILAIFGFLFAAYTVQVRTYGCVLACAFQLTACGDRQLILIKYGVWESLSLTVGSIILFVSGLVSSRFLPMNGPYE